MSALKGNVGDSTGGYSSPATPERVLWVWVAIFALNDTDALDWCRTRDGREVLFLAGMDSDGVARALEDGGAETRKRLRALKKGRSKDFIEVFNRGRVNK